MEKEYSRLEDLDRLIEALGMSPVARAISPAQVFELCLAEIALFKEQRARAIKERDLLTY